MKIKKFKTASGLEVFVGQDDASNDYLSLKIARANDLWFHIAGFPGSHVVLDCKDREVEKEDIEQAAQLAGWFSRMRNGKNVAIHYCKAQNVFKPRGSKSGTVSIKQAKKIKINPALISDWQWYE